MDNVYYYYMGPFELEVMASILRLGEDAYGRRLHSDIERRRGRSVGPGQIYVVLARLERAGLIKSHMGEPTGVRGGRAKRLYDLTAKGKRAQREAIVGVTNLLSLLTESESASWE